MKLYVMIPWLEVAVVSGGGPESFTGAVYRPTTYRHFSVTVADLNWVCSR